MALLVCEECDTRYAVGAPRCPQCGSEASHEETEEDQMPKISKHAGPSYEGILEPRHVTYDDDAGAESREETDGDELTGETEPVTVYESGKNPPELETPAIVSFGEEPAKSTGRKQRDAERRESQ